MTLPHASLPHRALAVLALCLASPAMAEVLTRPLSELAEPAAGQASAQVMSPNDSVIAAEISAAVATIRSDVGATVARGELLVELDASDARLMLAQADAQVAAARANFEMATQRLARARQLREQQFASADDLLARSTEEQAAKAELAVREAARRIAARSVDKTRILAPFDGVVVERHAQVGALAAPGTPLLRIVDLAAPEVEAALQSSDALGIGQSRDLRFESQGRSWPLRLSRLSPVADRASRTQVARFAFADAPAPAGLAGVLRWDGPQRVLPPELMVKRGDQLGAFAIEDGRARFVAAPGAQEGRSFSVDLAGTTLIVIQGQQGLVDGQAVAAGRD